MCRNSNTYHWQSTLPEGISTLAFNNSTSTQNIIWNNSTIMSTSWSAVVPHLERIWAPCARSLNMTALIHSPLMRMSCSTYALQAVSGTLPWLSLWAQITLDMDNSWKTTKTTSHKGWINTHTQGWMPSIYWLIVRRTNETMYWLYDPMMA